MHAATRTVREAFLGAARRFVCAAILFPHLYPDIPPVSHQNCEKSKIMKLPVPVHPLLYADCTFKLTRIQRSPLVIIARARREGPGDEANGYPLFNANSPTKPSILTENMWPQLITQVIECVFPLAKILHPVSIIKRLQHNSIPPGRTPNKKNNICNATSPSIQVGDCSCLFYMYEHTY